MPSRSETAIAADAVVSMSVGVVDGEASREAICIDVLGDAARNSAYVRARFVASGYENSPKRPYKL